MIQRLFTINQWRNQTVGLQNLTETFNKKNILVIGDAILDEYVQCNRVGASLDAPHACEVEWQTSRYSFGGAGLVAGNILELGARVYFVSVIGNDEGVNIYETLIHRSLEKKIFIDPSRKTTIKKSYWSDEEKLFQVNKTSNHYISTDLGKRIFNEVITSSLSCDSIVVLDAQHGILSQNLIRQLLVLSTHKSTQMPLYINAQISHRPSNHHWYRGAHCIFLNIKEARSVDSSFSEHQLERSVKKLKKKLKTEMIVVTLGERGSCALMGKEFVYTPAYRVKAVDTNGAGDAFMAAFCLCDGLNLASRLKIANTWAALSTTVHGTKPPQKQDLERAIKNI